MLPITRFLQRRPAKKEPRPERDLAEMPRDVVIMASNKFDMAFGQIPNLVAFSLKPKLTN